MKLCATCNNTFADTETFCPHDGEVLQESPENIVGQVLDGKYKVESFIAQGGMGAVYRARHILLGDDVVIKTLRSEMRGNSEWLKRFQREGKAARAFRHPNSVTVYDLSAGTDGMIYMVMEYVEGHTLDKELKRRGRFTPEEALEILEPVADVLDSAHARGVVHRDLKPENIMLGRDDRGDTVVKVLDLGIAKMVGVGDVHAAGATSLTVAGQILGTPYYMSPEQWGEMPRDGDPEVDGRTDIYSLGVIFFELVAGRKPHSGRTLSELRQKHVAAPRPSLSDVVPGVPVAYSRAVARAMEKDRADRPQTAGEFVNELRASLGLQPHTRSHVIHATDAGSVHATGSADALGTQGGSEAATMHLTPETSSEGLKQSHADTILTSEFESRLAGQGRDTSAQGKHPLTSGNVAARHDASRETVVERAAETQGYTADSQRDRNAPPLADTRNAPQQDSAQQGAHVAQQKTGAQQQGAGAQQQNAFAQQGAGVSVTAPEQRRSFAPIIAGGAFALLIVLGVGGFIVWRSMRAKPDVPVANNQPATNTSAPPRPAVPAKTEAASYWFESFDKIDEPSGQRIAETAATLQSGKWFKFHFVPKERGYLYIIGPGANGNAQQTLLTAQGAGALKSNLVGAGADFAFPFGATKFKLDNTPGGADEFTFIFSPTPLMSPSFLTGQVLHNLTPAEVKELEDFRAQFKSDAPTVESKGEGDARSVVVSVPQSATAGNNPLIFDVRVNHR